MYWMKIRSRFRCPVGLSRGGIGLLAALLTIVLGQEKGFSQHPSAPQLFPESSVVCVRIHNVPEMKERFSQTSVGQILSDSQMRPLFGELYSEAQKAFEPVRERLGVSLDEILQIPQGEVALALISPEIGPFSVAGLFDAGDRVELAKKLFNRAREANNDLGPETIERVGQTELRIYPGRNARPAGDEPPADREDDTKKRRRRGGIRGGSNELCVFERNGILAFSNSREVAKSMIAAWDGERVPTLATNARFTAIMNRCATDKDGSPQLTWYVDPIAIAQRATQDSFSAQATFSILTSLGIQGIRAVGGSVILATEDYDSISHIHLALENPRSGLLDILAVRDGDTTPEPWAPSDAESYITAYWDVDQTYRAIAKIYNTFRGENAFANDVKQRASAPAGIDIEGELLPALDGRFTMVRWIERPVTLNSQTTLVGIRLKDAAAFRPFLERVISKFSDRIEVRNTGGVTTYTFKGPVDNPRPQREGIRQPIPCGAIVGDYLLVADSPKLLEHAIATQSDPSASLANELDFKLIASKVNRQAGGKQPGMLTFNRPEEGMRAMYDLATSDLGKNSLQNIGQDNRFFGTVDRALKNNPLPPFHVISQYLAPGGGLLTNDDTGLHYMAFSLRRKK